MKNTFKIGQTAYVQGLYRAIVVDVGPYTINCKVMEGIDEGLKGKKRIFGYAPALLKFERENNTIKSWEMNH